MSHGTSYIVVADYNSVKLINSSNYNCSKIQCQLDCSPIWLKANRNSYRLVTATIYVDHNAFKMVAGAEP